MKMGDLEAFGRFEYGKMEFLSPSRRLRPRSPSPSRLPLSFRRMRYLYARICLLVVGFPFMFSTLEKVCTSLFAQGLLTYVVSLVEWLPFVPGPSPLRQPQFLPWELNGSRTEFGEQHDDHNESTTTPRNDPRTRRRSRYSSVAAYDQHARRKRNNHHHPRFQQRYGLGRQLGLQKILVEHDKHVILGNGRISSTTTPIKTSTILL